MRVAAMHVKIVSIFILTGFTFGTHTDQDNADLEARTALPRPSWVDLGPEPFGGLPRQRDVVARKIPLETHITTASTSADITAQGEFSAYVPYIPTGYYTHSSQSRYPTARTSAHIFWR